MTITETRSNLDQLATLIREALTKYGEAQYLRGRYVGSAGAASAEASCRMLDATAAADEAAVLAWQTFYDHAGDYGAALIELDALRQAAAQHSALLERIDQVLPARAL